MRSITALTLLAALLLTAQVGWAGSMDAPEIEDPAGDAGPGELGTGPAGKGADILQAWFATEPSPTGSEEQPRPGACHPCGGDLSGSWALMEVAGFEMRAPQVIYAVGFQQGNTSAWVAYGSFVDPTSGGRWEGYYGCRSSMAEGHGEMVEAFSQHGDCQELEGALSDDGTGFRVHIPEGWAPPGATLTATEARTYLLPPAPPAGGEEVWAVTQAVGTLDTAGPGDPYTVPGKPDPGTEVQDEPAEPASRAEPDGGLDVPGLGPVALVVALAGASLAALALGGRGRA